MPDAICSSCRTSRLSLSNKGGLLRSLAYHTSRRTRRHSAFRATPGPWPSTTISGGTSVLEVSHRRARTRYGPAIPASARYPNLANTVNALDGGEALTSRTYHAQIARHFFCFFDQGSETSPDAFSPERFAPWVEIKRSQQLDHVLR